MAKQTQKKTAAAASKALTAPKAQPLSTSVNDLLLQDAGAGQEAMTREDYSIPRLAILQALSPQTKKQKPEYIKGAEEGMICDILNAKTFSGEEGIVVIPVSYRRAHIEWRPREKGGGFVKDHGANPAILEQCKQDPAVNKGQPTLPNGNTIATVGEYFVFLLDGEGGHCPYVLSMAGSQLKKSRRWNTMFNQYRAPHPSGSGTFNPAMFYRTYNLTTVPEQNDQGSWFGWKITPGEDVLNLEGGEALYVAAREFREQIIKGAVQATPANADHMAGGGGGGEGDDAPM